MNKRYRLVTRQNGSEHVSSVILTYDEAVEQIVAEAIMHEDTGWRVERMQTLDGNHPVELVCTNGRVTRTILIRESDWRCDILE